MKEIKRHTNTTLMNKIFEIIGDMPEYKRIADILDYKLAEEYDVAILTDYEFDIVALPQFGGSEGIYVTCFINGQFDSGKSRKLKMGTLKTLETSLEAMRLMGELCGLLTYVGTAYINKNIDIFAPGTCKRAKA